MAGRILDFTIRMPQYRLLKKIMGITQLTRQGIISIALDIGLREIIKRLTNGETIKDNE